jgi:hypothetical protein
MSVGLIIVAAIVVGVVLFLAYRFMMFKGHKRKLDDLRFERIKPLFEKLDNGEIVTLDDVVPFAENLLTRATAFHLLSKYNKQDLFPEKYNSLLKGAESYLANWLEFPTELDACPDEMVHIQRVTFAFEGPEKNVHYEVFKYRVNEPHWAAKNGWILGVVGPYFDNSKPYDPVEGTFSRVSSSLDNHSPEEEAKWVHENISMK